LGRADLASNIEGAAATEDAVKEAADQTTLAVAVGVAASWLVLDAVVGGRGRDWRRCGGGLAAPGWSSNGHAGEEGDDGELHFDG